MIICMVAMIECICHVSPHGSNKVSAGATQHNIHRVHFSMYLLAQRNIIKCTMVSMMHDSNIRMYVCNVPSASATYHQWECALNFSFQCILNFSLNI